MPIGPRFAANRGALPTRLNDIGPTTSAGSSKPEDGPADRFQEGVESASLFQHLIADRSYGDLVTIDSMASRRQQNYGSEKADIVMEQKDSALPLCAPHGLSGWMVLIAMIPLVDVTLYRSLGFAGPAVFFPTAVALLLWGRGRIDWNTSVIVMSSLLILLSASMIWAGGFGQIIAAVWLLIATNLAAQGVVPYLLESTVALAATVPGGYEFLHSFQLNWRRVVLDPVDHGRPSRAMNFLLPIISVIVFGTVFVFANPDVIKELSTILSGFYEHIRIWMSRFSAFEIVVWCVTFWVTAGLLCPAVRKAVDTVGVFSNEANPSYDHPMFAPFRNTLATLISLFVVYLIFEFFTLWFRKFPEGFHYSGYAHEGAAWLTVALGLATLTLSLIFRGSMMNDPRIPSLKKLAWVWSALNFLLAASVYNRLLIYVDFNGMTRMRVVGLLGISAVMGGFVLVLFKIVQQQRFIWLIRRQLWILAFAIYLNLAVPVDILIHRYNVQRILTGSEAPCVQISEHPIADDALPQLLPLLASDNQTIREGVRAMLRNRLNLLQWTNGQNSQHWTTTQFGKSYALQKLQAAEASLEQIGTDTDASSALQSFHDYAMQWW